jgi:hypothetical protein
VNTFQNSVEACVPTYSSLEKNGMAESATAPKISGLMKLDCERKILYSENCRTYK